MMNLFLQIALLTHLHVAHPPSQAEDIAELKQLVHTFTLAYEARDADALLQTMVDNDQLTLFLPNPFVPLLIEGRTQSRQVIDTFFRSIPQSAIFQMTTHDDAFYVFDDMAINTNYTNIYLSLGGTNQKFLARTTNVFKRTSTGWKIVHINGSPFPKESAYLTYEGAR